MSTVKDRLTALTREDLVDKFKETTNSLITLFDKKSEDYDIDFYKEVGGYYLLLRIREKYHRLHNLLQKDGQPSNEPIEDTIKDLSTIFTALYSMMQFDLVSLEQLKIQYQQALQVDVAELIAKEDEKKRKKQKKWWQVWRR